MLSDADLITAYEMEQAGRFGDHVRSLRAVAEAAVNEDREQDKRWQFIAEGLQKLIEVKDRRDARAVVKDRERGEEPVAWALVWEVNGERDVHIYDDEADCVFVAQSYGGICRPLVFADARPAAVVPDGWKLIPVDPTVAMRKTWKEMRGYSWHDKYKAMLAAAPEPTPMSILPDDTIATKMEGWQPIETAPKTGRTILLGYFNKRGNWRTMLGQWMSLDYIADHWDDPEGVKEGWFETSVEADDIPNCWETSPTHWMPLPTPLVIATKEEKIAGDV